MGILPLDSAKQFLGCATTLHAWVATFASCIFVVHLYVALKELIYSNIQTQATPQEPRLSQANAPCFYKHKT